MNIGISMGEFSSQKEQKKTLCTSNNPLLPMGQVCTGGQWIVDDKTYLKYKIGITLITITTDKSHGHL